MHRETDPAAAARYRGERQEGMSRAKIVISDAEQRARAIRWCQHLPLGTRIEFKKTQRTLPQNDRMWAMLTDISEQAVHAGRRFTPTGWKNLMMHGCGCEIEMVPSLDNSTMIPFGQSSSDLSIEEMTSLIEFMFWWGAQPENAIKWSDPALRALLQAAE